MNGLADGLKFRVGLDLSPAERGLRAFGGKLSSTLAAVSIGGGFAGLTASVGAFAKGAIDAGAQAEGFESKLSTLMGSSTAARERIEELYDFAARTPYNTAEIVAAEVTMRGFGAAADELMPGLIDFAALTGTELPQAARDFGKAWQIGATGLESDGGRLLRAQIELRTGIDATKMKIEDFREAMLDTLSDGMFAGGADRLSRTFTGMVSNLVDEWGRLKRQVADAGVFNNVKGVLAAVLDLIADNRDTTAQWATVASDVLWAAFQGVGYTIAAIVDTTRGLEMVVLAVAAGSVRLTEGFLSGLAAVVRIESAFNRMAGADGALQKSTEALGRLTVLRGEAAELRDNIDSALISAATGASATETWSEIIAKGKENAAQFADEIERAATTSTTPRQEGDGKDGFGKGWEALIAEQEAMLAAAAQFSAEMNALDDTREEQIRKLMYQRLVDNQRMLDEMALSQEQAAANEVLIKSAAAAELKAIDDDVARARLDNVAMYVGWVGDAFDLIATLSDNASEQQKAAHKRWAIASVLIDAAAGVMQEVARNGLPGLASAIPIGIAAAGQIASITKQHQGGVVYAHQGRYPDEYDRGGTRRLTQEATLNSQATRSLGSAGVAALNGGASLGPQVVELRVGRAVQRELLADAMLPGGQLDQRLAEQRRTSDRVDVGFSGALAV